MYLVLSAALLIIHTTDGSVEVGFCTDYGTTKQECQMECRSDGSCEESGTETSCDCDGNLIGTAGSFNFQAGQGMTGVGATPTQCLNQLSKRCRQCTRSSRSGSASAQNEKSQFCSGNRRGDSNRNGGFNRGGSSQGGSNNGGSNQGGGSRSSTAASCNDKANAVHYKNGNCIYSCNGDITGLGTCATEHKGSRGGKCGSCFGQKWGGGCTGEPSQCTSCSSFCVNKNGK